MPSRALKWTLLSGALVALATGCGRSLLFTPVAELSPGGTTSSSSSSSGSSSSSTSGSSSGGTCGVQGDSCSDTAVCCSGLNCRRGTCRGGGASSSGTVSSSGSSGGCGPDNCQDFCPNNCAPSDTCVSGEWNCGCVCGGSSSGTVSSSGGSSGSNGCTPGGPTTALTPCNVPSDCGCPLVCSPTLAGQSLCEEPCQSTGDCADLYTLCQKGSCQPNICGLGGNGQIDGTCNAVGKNDGTCLALSIMGFNLGLCYQGGTATSSCSLSANRQNLSQDCIAGDFCAGATCEQVCNPNGSVPCPTGATCVTPIAQEPQLGLCVGGGGSSGTGGCSGTPPNCSCPSNCLCFPACQGGSWTCSELCSGGSSGSGGGSSSGNGGCGTPPPPCPCNVGCSCSAVCESGGWVCTEACTSGGSSSSSSGGSSGGACSPKLTVTEMGPCQSSADCGCPTICVNDALAGRPVCQYPCTQSSECPNLYTVCTGVSCTVDLCGVAIGGPPNGTLDGPCNSAGVNDGTCFATAPADGGQTFGICSQGGSSQTNCSATATRADLSQACAEGYLCGQGIGSSNVCYVVCNPTVASSVCRMNQTCTNFDPADPQLGICYP